MLHNVSNFLSRLLNIVHVIWLKLTLAFKKDYDYLENHHDLADNAMSATKHLNISSIIPKAKGLPLFGTYLELIAAGAPQLHKYIDKRHKQLGPIFYEHLGEDAIFISSASLMRTVFLYEGKHPKHPVPKSWVLYNRLHNCERGLFFMEGVEWFHNRRFLNRFLLNGNLNWMNINIDTCVVDFINELKFQIDTQPTTGDTYYDIPNLESQLYRWAIQVICSIMFGSSVCRRAEIRDRLNEFSEIVHTIFECSSTLMNFPPKLAKLLRLKMWSRFEESVSEVLQKGSELIDIFVELKYNNEINTDSENECESLFNKLQSSGMPMPIIKRIFTDLVIAAGDTTAYTSEWALFLLSQDDDLQYRIGKEVTSLEENDFSLVHGLIKETLRLYPVAPFIGRYLACDAKIGNYQIKKDTLVLLSLYTAGRDSSHFPEPLSVNPERWQRNKMTDSLQGVFQAHASLPFAIGNRSCIGRRIAIKQIHALITAFACNFYLKCTNAKPINSILRLVTVPNQPLQLVIKLRGNND